MLNKAINDMYYEFVDRVMEEVKNEIIEEFGEEKIESLLEVEYNDSFDLEDEAYEQHDEIIEYIEGILWDSCFSDNEIMCQHICERIIEELHDNFRG